MSSPFFENPVHPNRVFCFITVFGILSKLDLLTAIQELRFN